MLSRKIATNKALLILSISIWLALNLADTLLTLYMQTLGGQEIWFVYKMTASMMTTIIIKWIFVLAIALTITLLRDKKAGKLSFANALWILNIWMTFVVGWNIYQLIK